MHDNILYMSSCYLGNISNPSILHSGVTKVTGYCMGQSYFHKPKERMKMTNHKPLQAIQLLLTRNNPHYTIIYTCVYTEKKSPHVKYREDIYMYYA